MFYIQRAGISADRPGYSGIVFDCSLQNRANRTATVISQEYELWLSKDGQSGQAEFLSRLSFDLTSQSIGSTMFKQQESRGFKLIWHFSPHQLQRIEDFRQGKEPYFEIRSRLVVQLLWVNPDGTPHGDFYFAEEGASDSETNGYPVRFKMDHVKWAALLDQIGFRHIILQELSIPTFPPEFKRAERHLKEAWEHHRAGRERPALLSCFNAFECLGFHVAGTPEITRKDVLALLMDGQEEEKQKKIKAVWETLGSYYHLGRHDKGPPVQLTHSDGELAVVSATVLLRYLAG